MSRSSRFVLVALLSAAAVAAQQQPPSPSTTPRSAPSGAPSGAAASWCEGLGRGPSRRAALAAALGDAVARARGAWLASGPAVQSRLAVVAGRRGDAGEVSSGWVARQVAGFIEAVEVQEQREASDGQWVVRARARVAAAGAVRTPIVVELQDSGLRSWVLERFEEGGPERAFDRRTGAFQGPKIADYLRRSGAVEVVAAPPGPAAAGAADALSASHRVRLEWQPARVRSLVEKPNRARPTKGPRPEHMSAGVVDVSVHIDDLARGVTVLDETLAISAPASQRWSIARLDRFVTELVDLAKARVAQKIFFALQPPVVLRKWAGDGGDWFVEARVGKRVAGGFSRFVLGVDGSLTSPDWQQLATAELVGGSDASCVFRLQNLTDPSRVEVGVCQVLPSR